MTDPFAALRAATKSALLQSPGATSVSLRQQIARGETPADLSGLLRKIRARAYTVTDADLDALRDRYTDDQLFEIVLAAALGAADERLAAAQRALEEA